MIIQCPQCQSRFKLPVEKTKTGGTKVRCTKCKSIFFITPPGDAKKPDSAFKQAQNSEEGWAEFFKQEENPVHPGSEKEPVDFFGENFDAAEFFAQGDDDGDFFLNGEPAPEPLLEEPNSELFPELKNGFSPDENQGDFEKTDDSDQPKIQEKTFADMSTGGSVRKTTHPLTLAEEEPSQPEGEFYQEIRLPHIPPVPDSLPRHARKKRSSMGPLLFLLFLVLLAAGGFLLYQQGKLPDYLQPWKKKQEALPSSVDLRPADLSGYHERNSLEGNLFIVRGKVVNHGSEARAGIQVSGVVFDRSGAIVARQTAYCGNPFNRSELRSLRYERMMERMNNQFGEVLSNINIEPNKSVPFVIVFRGIPQDVAEFGVEVIDSKPVVK